MRRIMTSLPPFELSQPYGKNKARDTTIFSEHATAAEAFPEIEPVSAQMVRTGAPRDAIELIVVDVDGQIVPPPRAH
jgi:hypothetical protein